MLDRTIAPAFVRSPEIKLKEAEHELIHGKIPFHYISGGTQEVIKIEAVFKGGKWFEKTSGAAYFTVKMLREGTENFTSKEISSTLDHYGAFIELSSGFDYSSVGLYCLNKYLDKVLPVFAEIIDKPVFPEEQLELMKEIELQSLKIDLKKSSFTAQRLFRQVLFGDNVAYGKTIDQEDIIAINRKDLADHYRNHYSNFEIFASGQFDSNDILTQLEQYLPKGEKLNLSINKEVINHQYTPKDIFKDGKNNFQSSLRIGFPTISKHHKDYISLQILNHLLGGYFGSRLMKNIREDKGYTYGIHSSLVSLIHGSYFTIATDVVKASADDAVSEIKKEMEVLKSETVPLEELETVKNHIMGSFQSDITSPFSLLDKYKSLYLHNLDYSYYEEYFKTLDKITSEDLLELANKYFLEEELSIVKVG